MCVRVSECVFLESILQSPEHLTKKRKYMASSQRRNSRSGASRLWNLRRMISRSNSDAQNGTVAVSLGAYWQKCGCVKMVNGPMSISGCAITPTRSLILVKTRMPSRHCTNRIVAHYDFAVRGYLLTHKLQIHFSPPSTGIPPWSAFDVMSS